MSLELTKADRELIEQLVNRLEEEGATIEDIEMEAAQPELFPSGEARSAIDFTVRGRIERTENVNRNKAGD